MMTERTLSRLLLATTLIVILGFVLMKIVFPDVAMPGYIRYGYAVAFGTAPILLVMKGVSRIFLMGLKGQPLSSIEQMFMVFYVLLTKEAREEWQSYITDQKNQEAT
jgi:hypothetical protein